MKKTKKAKARVKEFERRKEAMTMIEDVSSKVILALGTEMPSAYDIWAVIEMCERTGAFEQNRDLRALLSAAYSVRSAFERGIE